MPGVQRTAIDSVRARPSAEVEPGSLRCAEAGAGIALIADLSSFHATDTKTKN